MIKRYKWEKLTADEIAKCYVMEEPFVYNSEEWENRYGNYITASDIQVGTITAANISSLTVGTITTADIDVLKMKEAMAETRKKMEETHYARKKKRLAIAKEERWAWLKL